MKKLLLRTMLLLCALIVGSGSAWAEDKTLTFVQTSSTAGTLSGDVPTGVTATFKTTYTGNKDQLTNGNSMTLTLSGWSSDVTITGVTLEVKNNKSSGDGTATVTIGATTLGTFSITGLGNSYQEKEVAITPTKTTSDLVITISATANSVYCDKFVISYSDVADTRVATAITISDDGITNKDVYVGTAAGKLGAMVIAGPNTISDAVVTWESSNTNVATIAEDGTVTLVAAGETTIKASYAGKDGEYKPSSNTYTLTVTDSNPDVPGTKNNPYTVAQAIANTPASGTSANVYIVGIVSKFYKDDIVSDGTNYRYYISDDGMTDNQLLVFKGKGLNNVAFSSATDLEIGDKVVILGGLTTYNSTKEVASGNYIVKLTRVANSELAWSESEITIEKGASESEYTLPTLVNPNNVAPITYTITGTENLAIEVDGTILVDTDVEGSVTVTAKFAGNDDYKAANVSYTITVYDPNVKGTFANPYTVAEVIDGTATGNGIYVKGFIVGEYVGKTTNPRTSGFSTDANFAIADEFTTSPSAGASCPIALPTDALKAAWGNKTNKGATMGYQVILKGNADTYFQTNGIKSVTEVTAVAAAVSVTDAQYATMNAKIALDYTGTGITAYTAKANDNGVLLTPIVKVPANTPVVLYKETAGTVSVPLAETTDEVGDNDLVAGPVTGDGASHYVLGKNASGDFGFGKLAADAALPANKAYIPASKFATGAPFFAFVFADSETTGINAVNGSRFMVNGSQVYNLNGQRVANPTKGLYIVNGKKVAIK